MIFCTSSINQMFVYKLYLGYTTLFDLVLVVQSALFQNYDFADMDNTLYPRKAWRCYPCPQIRVSPTWKAVRELLLISYMEKHYTMHELYSYYEKLHFVR